LQIQEKLSRIVRKILRLTIDIGHYVSIKTILKFGKISQSNYEDHTVLLADSTLIKPPEELETFTDEPAIIFLSLDDDEENIGFDELEDIDDDELDDDDDFDDDFDDEEEEEEEFDDEEEEDDEFDDEFDDDDDDF
tara:strand:+ start:12480 stop:12887 length:408 start_codon:yes stop_codon:yes gene_type:complete